MRIYHSQRTSERTVPTRPFKSSQSHCCLEGHSKTSQDVRWNTKNKGHKSNKLNRPTNPRN